MGLRKEVGMKEVIGIVVVVAMVLGGNVALKRFHDTVRRAALENASKGLPSLTEMTRSLQRQKANQKEVKK